MARRNRIVVADGCYHITSRTANREMLFKDPAFKDRIVEWLHGIADFSGVEIMSYAIMDNHFHVFLKTPTVPERYWTVRSTTVPSASNEVTVPVAEVTVPARPPCAESFGMRPRECRAPRWTPDLGDERPIVTPAGERLSVAAVEASVADGVPAINIPRPPVGFAMDDGEMIGRLRRLYSGWSNGADAIAKKWRWLREHGMGDVVETEKEGMCRRMYNVSQFAKTFKERISAGYRRFVDRDHVGTLWEGRFYSGLVEEEFKSRLLVSAYVDYNPVKARIASAPSKYRWCSWSEACNGDGMRCESYRKHYCSLFGCEWGEAKSRMESLFSTRMPDSLRGMSEDAFCDWMKELLSRASGAKKTFVSVPAECMIGRLVKLSLVAMKKGAFISFDREFAKRTAERFSGRFPMPGSGSIWRLARAWKAAMSLAA